jgi:hypothetical protein
MARLQAFLTPMPRYSGARGGNATDGRRAEARKRAAKNPAARPGFVFVEAGAEECGLIFRDDRRRSVSFELVADPGLHLVFLQATLPVEKTALGKHSTPTDSAEIGKAVFGPDRPIVGESIFDSAADRPAGAGVRTAS